MGDSLAKGTRRIGKHDGPDPIDALMGGLGRLSIMIPE